jgi:hypothetical protein
MVKTVLVVIARSYDVTVISLNCKVLISRGRWDGGGGEIVARF